MLENGWRKLLAAMMRDGQQRNVRAAEIVRGDIILVEEGDTIPADTHLLHSIALQTAKPR